MSFRTVGIFALIMGLGTGSHASVDRIPSSEYMPRWDARLVNGGGRIKLIVNTEDLKNNTYLVAVRCTVDFFSSSGVKLGTQTFWFTDGGEKLLPEQQRYEKTFSNPYPAAHRVVGDVMRFTPGVFGQGAGWNPVPTHDEMLEEGKVGPDPDLQEE